jgi:hypothetical protein
MDSTRVISINLVRTGSWVTGKVTVSLPDELRASASRTLAARVEDAPAELSELAGWALEASMHVEGFWG